MTRTYRTSPVVKSQHIVNLRYLRRSRATRDCITFNAMYDPRPSWYEAYWVPKWYGAKLTIRFCWTEDNDG